MLFQKPAARAISLFLILYILLSSSLHAQTQLVQLSGIITDAVTQYPIAYAEVRVPSNSHSVNASTDGFFSLVVNRADTIQFSALGYKSKYYVVPDTGSDDIASIAVFLSKDTLTLDAVEIYPWPSREEFRDAFLAWEDHQQNVVGPLPGLKRPDQIDTIPKAPNPILNPISFIYDEVVKPIQWQHKKRNMVDKLPEWKLP